MKGVYFISGIDTDIGKTVAVGWLAKRLLNQGINVITQKLVQTGCQDLASDILVHRNIMGVDLQEADKQKLTMPAVFSYPASPHLAAKIDQCRLNVDDITHATQTLSQQYETVLLEGAGGLLVPLTENLLTLDYIRQQNYPVILVSSGRLGSINHTLLSLAVLKQYGMSLHSLIFNHIHDSQDTLIAEDCRHYLQKSVAEQFPKAEFWDLPVEKMD